MRTWARVGLLGALLFAIAGCAGNSAGKKASEPPSVRAAQALDSAAEAQKGAADQAKRAGEARREAQQAREDVQKAEQRAQTAQQKAEQEQLRAQQMQQQATRVTQQATQQASQAQQLASQALAPAGASGAQTLAGNVARSSGDQLVVRSPSGEERTFQVTPQTTFQIDGRQASAMEIAPGADVRVSHDGQRALSVEVGSGNTGAR